MVCHVVRNTSISSRLANCIEITNKKTPQQNNWKNKQNVVQFLKTLQTKYNLNSTDSITVKQIRSNGGGALLNQYSLYDLKYIGNPSGKFKKRIQYKPAGHWEDKKNVKEFLEEIKIKYNLKSIDDWKSITSKQIQSYGGGTILHQYSIYDLKYMAFPNEESNFDKPIQCKGYWNDYQNIIQFLDGIQVKYNLKTPQDWNSITTKHIISNGGSSLLKIYSLYDLKCLGFPSGKLFYTKPIRQKSAEFWNEEENRNQFIQKIQEKFNLKTPQDWERLSTRQIKAQGGLWLFYNNMEYLKKTIVNFEIQDENTNEIKKISKTLKELIGSKCIFNKRSSQRWLFLQVQKLFPNEEIVEDYFHSDISRESGFSVQFDVFLTKRKIAFEYHGEHHYEDIPSGFAPLEMHQNRDLEKQKLCSKFGIQLIVIPYWWDNKLDSLRETLNSLNKDISSM